MAEETAKQIESGFACASRVEDKLLSKILLFYYNFFTMI